MSVSSQQQNKTVSLLLVFFVLQAVFMLVTLLGSGVVHRFVIPVSCPPSPLAGSGLLERGGLGRHPGIPGQVRDRLRQCILRLDILVPGMYCFDSMPQLKV